MGDPNHIYASDTRTSAELVEAHRKELDSDSETRQAMAGLHFRGGKTEFEIGKRLATSKDSVDRSIGADILAQLGWEKKTFHDESVDIMIKLLNDPDPFVIYCAAVGLGHRNDERAIAPLVQLAQNQDPQVRYGVTLGLINHDDEQAISALIQLSRDTDHDTKNWAMFGLGTMTEMDTPALRDALMDGLNELDSEIRGEALVGLARRKDSRVKQALIKELTLDEIHLLSLEAAETLADPDLLPFLREVEIRFDFQKDSWGEEQLQAAIAACKSSIH